MVLSVGEKVHIVERRYFEEDLRRHFVGEVVKCTENAFRVAGYAWAFDTIRGTFIRKPEKRERVFYPGDRLTINVIPQEVALDEVKYSYDRRKGHIVTDGKKFSLEITEFTAMR